MTVNVDLNCDLGEGMPNDKTIMPYLGSCNIAAGGHIGNAQTVMETIKLAKKHQVKIGAHPSYPDRINFGRLPMAISFSVLEESLVQQISLVKELAAAENRSLHHIKFHGALYLSSLTSQKLAHQLAQLIATHYDEVLLYAPYGSCMAEEALLHNIPIKYEGFADRAYLTGSELVSRKHPEALITNLEIIKQQVLSMVNSGRILAIDKKEYAIKVDTLCIHGDHPKALEIAQLLAPLI
ncbi:LamB/YcsF family protein [uncultured Cyclobacterium sp.]|uniref:LamB/YcsF family protein n=1 Tax=uncultured Cyclobacterium sp. TaxID=453820 RepID=UPI0030EF8FA4|tara:strand:+ start:28104 stop:28817 length:714 start_codon:yes stop_codon:yes gene_type:complete